MLRSMSSSVVLQPLTLTRIARTPCQVVGPHQHVPSSWTAAITASVRSVPPNDTSTWLSTTSFSTSNPARAIPAGEPARQAAAPVHQLRDAVAAERGQRSPHLDAARPLRGLRRQAHALAALPGRYDADAPIAARSASGSRTSATPQS